MFSPGFHQFHVFTRFSLKMKQQCRMRLGQKTWDFSNPGKQP